jgi:hypothetical protein
VFFEFYAVNQNACFLPFGLPFRVFRVYSQFPTESIRSDRNAVRSAEAVQGTHDPMVRVLAGSGFAFFGWRAEGKAAGD